MLFQNMTEAYPFIVQDVLDRGNAVQVRDGLNTLELLDYNFIVEDAVHGGAPIGVGRKLGRKMQLIDGLNNLAAVSHPESFLIIAPFLDRFADTLAEEDGWLVKHRSGALPGEKFWQGQYGPRIATGMRQAIAELQRDPSSRRAVVNVWDPMTDYDPKWRDRPCVSQFQFIMRDGELEMFVTMRSNDVWTGLAYDVFQMGQIQAAACSVLDVSNGPYHHHVVSMHAYAEDIDKLAPIKGDKWVDNPRETSGPKWYGVRYPSIIEMQASFQRLVWSPRLFVPQNEVEAWYRDEYMKALP